jgi:hypothetical protein
MTLSAQRLFLLSPARLDGKRAQILTRPEAAFDLAVRLRTSGVPLGEVFSFMSGLYFRGKLAYARAFTNAPGSEAFVITSAFGLVSPDKIITLSDLAGLAAVPVDTADARYVQALQRDAHRLAERLQPGGAVILLGSVATGKYMNPLLEVLDDRLLFPEAFIGRGDLSRGGLLLRAAATGVELAYRPVGPSTHHGPRPARLAPLPIKNVTRS